MMATVTDPAFLVGGIVFVSLTIYALLAGADFGGGVWDLLARGPRAVEQRKLIARAIGPIWEANHVWMILAIVLVFICFPLAYATIGTALHIPLTLMLLGIVLRGSSFVFRAYDSRRDDVQARWSVIFAVSSTFTPVMLGVCVGAIASGRIRVDPATHVVSSGFFETWLAPFPFAVGFFALALFSLLAATYLTLEADNDALREDFRVRGLGAAVAVGIFAFAALALSGTGAPQVRDGLLHSWWSLPFQLVTGTVAIGGIAALYTRRYPAARLLVGAQTALIIGGWGISQYPYVVVPDLTLQTVRAPDNVLWTVIGIIGVGAVALVPSFAYLYAVFKER